MQELMSTKEVARFLDINEKMVYTLISEKGLPAAKITGKWTFPRHLVERWVESHTINHPGPGVPASSLQGLLVIIGSHDPLLEQVISGFNGVYQDQTAVYGSTGSMGGIASLAAGRCHMAACHLLSDTGDEYNFPHADRALETMPAVVNFSRREQGILLAPGNPLQICEFGDLSRPGLRIIHRPKGSGTRLLFEKEAEKAGIRSDDITACPTEAPGHMDAGLAVLSGMADAAMGIRSVAACLGLAFLPLRWERFDLLISKDRYFDQSVQRFLGFLHQDEFVRIAAGMEGYDISESGRMMYPGKPASKEGDDSSGCSVEYPSGLAGSPAVSALPATGGNDS